MKSVSGNEGRPRRESEMKGEGAAGGCDSRAGTSVDGELGARECTAASIAKIQCGGGMSVMHPQ
jgi:hypothetical protein